MHDTLNDSKLLSYNDITLVPQYFDGHSRIDLNTSVCLGHKEFKFPAIPANMACCIDFTLARFLSDNDYFYVLHRFYDYSDIKTWLSDNGDLKTISLSVGVKPEDYEFVDWMSSSNQRIDYLTVDVAHGHCRLMKDMLTYIKSRLPDTFVIAGNVATPEATVDLRSWGADAVKVGIGDGKACTTKLQTGFHSPMFSAVRNICRSSTVNFCDEEKFPIIADGGIRHPGDIAKALVAGATMVMAGSIFTACIDSPAENVLAVHSHKVTHKKYFGSASAKNKGHSRNVEGKEVLIPCNQLNYEDFLLYLKGHLQSSISYAGGKDLSVFKNVLYSHC